MLDESVKYLVPEYQRNFEWKKEHAEEFWEDVSSGSVFLGTFVLDIHKISENEVYIVDGQQRITTIFVFLAACRYQAKKINSLDQAFEIQRKISFIDDTSGKASSSKLIPSKSVSDVFIQTITSDEWDGKKFEIRNKKLQIRKIKPIYEYFVEQTSKLDKDELAELLKKLYESTFVRIEIEETQDAFEIFERTNARGLELNAADLLKNYLFARSASEKLEEEWDAIIENSNRNILRMIKYYYVSQFGPVQKKELFKKLKKHGEEVGADTLLANIKEFSYYYALIVAGSYETIVEWAHETENKYFLNEYNAKALNRALDALQLFGVTQAYPLIAKLFIILSSVKEAEFKIRSSKELLSFLISLEKFHFINYAVSQRPGNQVEDYYARKCESSFEEKQMAPFIEKIVKELKIMVVGKAEFIEKFSDINYVSNFSLIYYIFDRLNNFERKGAQYDVMYNPDKRLLRKNFDIDHLVSQNMDEYDFSEEEIGEAVDNIGNLLVMSKHSNGAAQNKNILEKLNLLEEKDLHIPEVKILVQEWKSKKWNNSSDVLNNIKERVNSLAERAYDIVWKI